jgi:hypothetical protein
MVKNTEAEGRREMTQRGDLPSLAGGECSGWDDLYIVMDGLYCLPGQWQRDSCILYSYLWTVITYIILFGLGHYSMTQAVSLCKNLHSPCIVHSTEVISKIALGSFYFPSILRQLDSSFKIIFQSTFVHLTSFLH